MVPIAIRSIAIRSIAIRSIASRSIDIHRFEYLQFMYYLLILPDFANFTRKFKFAVSYSKILTMKFDEQLYTVPAPIKVAFDLIFINFLCDNLSAQNIIFEFWAHPTMAQVQYTHQYTSCYPT